MTTSKDDRGNQVAKKSADSTKKERAASALRANLQRRKQATQQPAIEQ